MTLVERERERERARERFARHVKCNSIPAISVSIDPGATSSSSQRFSDGSPSKENECFLFWKWASRVAGFGWRSGCEARARAMGRAIRGGSYPFALFIFHLTVLRLVTTSCLVRRLSD